MKVRRVVTDSSTLKPRIENVAGFIQTSICFTFRKTRCVLCPWQRYSPYQQRKWDCKKYNSDSRNCRKTSHLVARWKYITYFSDKTGEYELTIKQSDGEGEETVLTKLGAGFKYTPYWSPDSKKIVFVDQIMQLHLHDIEAKKTTVIDKFLWRYHGDLTRFRPEAGHQIASGLLMMEMAKTTTHSSFFMTQKKEKRYQVTGYYNDDQPTF